jgi:hypothetical protein
MFVNSISALIRGWNPNAYHHPTKNGLTLATADMISLVFICVIGALAVIWLLLNREKTAPPVSTGELESLSENLHESSTEFDLESLPAFLRRVAPHLSGGFGEQQIMRLVSAAEQLPHNREAQFEFQVVFQTAATPLQVRFFKGDVSSVGVYFFTSQPLAELLDREMEAFAVERGQ